MKRSVQLSLLLLSLSCFQFVSAAAKIPAKLQGLWIIDATATGNWDAFTIVDNHVEFFYDLYQLDSISGSSQKYQIWLSSKAKGKMWVRVELNSDSVGTFQFDKWNKPRTAKLVSKHPDMAYFPIEEAQHKVKGDWIFSDNVSDAFSIRGKQVFMDQQRWNIVWFGEYLSREYRALVKYKTNYRLIYLTKSGRTLRVATEGKSKNYGLKANNPAIYQLLGNWYEPETNKWTYGFFEDFAIYNNEFWDYGTFAFSKNKGNITLKKGGRTVNLEFDKKSDSLISIIADAGEKYEYRKAGKTLPAYSTKDETGFKDTHFQKMDTAYITGYLRNTPNLEPFEVTRLNIVNGDEEKVYADVDSLGRFFIKVPLANTQQVFMDWHRTNKIDVLEPGEHYFLYNDFANEQYLLMGDNERLHNELARYKPYSAFTQSQESQARRAEENKMKGMDFLKAKRDDFEAANTHFSSHLNSDQHTSAKTRYFVRNFIRYYIASDLMQKRFDLDRVKMERFPAEYMAFVKDSFYTNPVKPFTLTRDFSTFSRDYVEYWKEDIEGGGVSHLQTLLHLITVGSIQTTDDEKKAVKLSWQIDSIGDVDSARSKKLAKSITQAQLKLVGNLRKVHESRITDAAVERLWSNILDSDYAFYQNVIPDEDIRSTYLAKAAMNYLDMTRKPFDNLKLKTSLDKIKSPVFQKNLVDYQNFLMQKTTIEFAHAASLKNTDHLKTAKDADSLFKALLAPYKGKVIYIDFWGTWCGPCRDEMKYVGNAKKSLKDKDVIFMYFANNSPEFTWKNMIKELDLTGENVVHYRLPDEQQYMLQRRLSVNSFPTYMLVDKEGNISTTKAPRPSDPNGLAMKVNELLK